MHTFNFQNAQTGAAITVKVLPRAKKTEVVGVMDDGTYRIRISAPPVEGAANRALIEFLSQALNIPPSQIDIVAGQFSERKLVSLVGITPAQVDEALGRLIPAAATRAEKAARGLKKVAKKAPKKKAAQKKKK